MKTTKKPLMIFYLLFYFYDTEVVEFAEEVIRKTKTEECDRNGDTPSLAEIVNTVISTRSNIITDIEQYKNIKK